MSANVPAVSDGSGRGRRPWRATPFQIADGVPSRPPNLRLFSRKVVLVSDPSPLSQCSQRV